MATLSGDAIGLRLRGDVDATSLNGTVSLTDVQGPTVKAESTSGNIELIGIVSPDVEASTVSGEVEFVGPLDPKGRYDFQSHSGAVTLTIPPTTSARFSVETFSGEVDSDFPFTLQPNRERRQGAATRVQCRRRRGSRECRILQWWHRHPARKRAAPLGKTRRTSQMKMLRSVVLASGLWTLASSVHAQDTSSTARDFRWTGALASGRWVYARNLNGSVRVERGTGTTLEVTAVKRYRRGNPEDVRVEVTRVGSGEGDVLVCAIWRDITEECSERDYRTRNNRRNRDRWYDNDDDDVSLADHRPRA